MRIIFALGAIFGSLFLFSLIPEFINFLIYIGIVPDEPRFRDSFWYQFQVLTVLWVLMWVLIFIGFIIMGIYTGFLDIGMTNKIKKAKARAIREFGMDLPYFSFIPKKYFNAFALDVSLYPRDVIWKYLSENKKLDIDSYYELKTEQKIKLYHEAREYYGLPDLEEYKILSYLK